MAGGGGQERCGRAGGGQARGILVYLVVWNLQVGLEASNTYKMAWLREDENYNGIIRNR